MSIRATCLVPPVAHIALRSSRRAAAAICMCVSTCVTAGAALPVTIDLATPGNLDGSPAMLLDDRCFAGSYGDLNDDGIDDLYAGNPYYLTEDGRALVRHGKRIIDSATQFTQTQVIGPADFAQTDVSITGGDFNGDGIDDIAVGAHTYQTGNVYIVYGGAATEGTTTNTSTPLSLQGGTDIIGAAADDRTGIGLTSGDINGDGFDDLVIGAWWADPSARDKAGAAYVVYGSAALPGTSINLFSNTLVTRILGGNAGDNLGFRSAPARLL